MECDNATNLDRKSGRSTTIALPPELGAIRPLGKTLETSFHCPRHAGAKLGHPALRFGRAEKFGLVANSAP
jgi:hypothetical protein